MSIPESLNFNLEIADLHAKRLKMAIERMSAMLPITAARVTDLKDDELFVLELFSSRFAKLQDLMGAKLFGLVLEFAKEPGSLTAFLDKLHRLEKLGCIPDSNKWLTLRTIRNSLSHEYPEHPDLHALFLNQALESTPFLLECLERIKAFVAHIVNTRI